MNRTKVLAPRVKGLVVKSKAISEDDRRKVYDVLSSQGPDVDMWSAAFGRLVGRAKKAGVVDDPSKLYSWLKAQGMFGPKSDSLRAEGDKFW